MLKAEFAVPAGVGVGLGVGLGNGVALGEGVGVGLGNGVGLGVGLGLGEGFGVGFGCLSPAKPFEVYAPTKIVVASARVERFKKSLRTSSCSRGSDSNFFFVIFVNSFRSNKRSSYSKSK